MSTTLNAKILVKKGVGAPGTVLDLGEFGYDTSTQTLYIGNGVGNDPKDMSTVPGVTSLSALTDVSIKDVSTNHALLFDPSGNTNMWHNVPSVNLADVSTLTEDASLYFQATIPFATKDSSATGNRGQWAFDASYLYLCTSTNVWMRVLGVSGY